MQESVSALVLAVLLQLVAALTNCHLASQYQLLKVWKHFWLFKTKLEATRAKHFYSLHITDSCFHSLIQSDSTVTSWSHKLALRKDLFYTVSQGNFVSVLWVVTLISRRYCVSLSECMLGDTSFSGNSSLNPTVFRWTATYIRINQHTLSPTDFLTNSSLINQSQSQQCFLRLFQATGQILRSTGLQRQPTCSRIRLLLYSRQNPTENQTHHKPRISLIQNTLHSTFTPVIRRHAVRRRSSTSSYRST